MDVLVYSNIKDVYVNTDTILALKTLKSKDLYDEKVRWACKLEYIHCGNVIADAFGLNKSILSNCPTYQHICNNSNALTEIAKVPVLYNAFKDDINANINVLSILQNEPSVAIGYLQQDWFLSIACIDVACIREIVKRQDYCNACESKINNYRKSIRSTLEKWNVPYTDKQIGNGSGTWTDAVNTNTLMMVWQCHDDSDTDYSVYHGNGNYRVVYIPRHGGIVTVDDYMCLRGLKLVGSGSSVGYIKYRYYSL